MSVYALAYHHPDDAPKKGAHLEAVAAWPIRWARMLVCDRCAKTACDPKNLAGETDPDGWIKVQPDVHVCSVECRVALKHAVLLDPTPEQDDAIYASIVRRIHELGGENGTGFTRVVRQPGTEPSAPLLFGCAICHATATIAGEDFAALYRAFVAAHKHQEALA